MNLNLRNFIMQNKDWQKKLSNPPYDIVVKEDEKNHLYLFKYSVSSCWENEAIRPLLEECRGTIYHVEDGEVECVHMGLKKFFNLEEPSNRYFPNIENCEIYQKIDGSNISFWFWKDRWHCSSLGCIDANEAVVACGRSLVQLVNEVLEMPFEQYCDMYFCRHNSYICELTHPDNRIVIGYDVPALWVICGRDHRTWEEFFVSRYEELPPHLNRIPTYTFNSMEQMVAAAKALPEDQEGYVVRDRLSNQRVKVKGLKYLELHHLRGNGIMNLRIWLKLREQECLDDFLAAFPQHAPQATLYENTFRAMMRAYNAQAALFSSIRNEDRATVARMVRDHDYADFLFKWFSGRVMNAEEYFKKQTTKKIEKFMRAFMEGESINEPV